ncbi:hypothetical protein [Paenibacillus maysiensis]|uniref:hypothetical protein n=1 Tax=Paenibacillus maysiensis TaxID=1155954 RepID=UPI0004B6A1CA|nr:hypothetical protein [Paenibacillus maysiensis]
MEKVKVLEIIDFEMEVQCDGSSCKYDCTEPNGLEISANVNSETHGANWHP